MEYKLRHGFALLSILLAVDVAQADRIEIRIPQGQITVRGIEKTGTFAVKASRDGKIFDPSLARVDKSGAQTTVTSTDPGSRDLKWEIQIPSDAGHKLYVYMQQGALTVQQWQGDGVLNLTQGQLNLTGVKGSFKTHVMKGQATITDSSGSIEAETAIANFNIQKFSGPYRITTLSGEVVINGVNGAGDIKSAVGQIKVNSGEGGINFDLIRGNLSLQNFKGLVEGDLREATSSFTMEPNTQLQVGLGSGRISVNAKKTPGAQLDLLSSEGGDFIVPNHLAVQKQGFHRMVKGYLKGERGEARISVRSREGSVSVSQ